MTKVIVIIIFIVALSVLVHYESLRVLTRWIQRWMIPHRMRIVVGVFGALFAHLLEIIIFATAYYHINRLPGWGRLQGNFDGSFLDCLYFSSTVYTTLGFGDIEPIGYLRYLTGVESLTGLVLITWTASFLFVEMQRYWEVDQSEG